MRSVMLGSITALVVSCGSSSPSHGPPDGGAMGRCGDGIVQREAGELCDGTTDAVCASGVGHPRCTAESIVDDLTCGVPGRRRRSGGGLRHAVHARRRRPAETPPLAEVTVGHDFACGLDRQGTAHCVQRPGSETLGRGALVFASPVDDFAHLEAGVDHVCGLRRDGSIACFGSNLSGQASPPPGTGYTSLASGGRYSCAARPGDRLRCWGSLWYE